MCSWFICWTSELLRVESWLYRDLVVFAIGC